METLEDLFDRIAKTYNQNKEKINNDDIMFSTTEELGELSRAIRIEDNYVLAGHKKKEHDSTEECIDVLLCITEMFVARGGTLEQFKYLIDIKLKRWEVLWRKENES